RYGRSVASSGPLTVRFVSKPPVSLEGNQPRLRLHCQASIVSNPGGRAVFIAVDIADQSSATIMQAEPRCQPFIGGKPGTYHVDMQSSCHPRSRILHPRFLDRLAQHFTLRLDTTGRYA